MKFFAGKIWILIAIGAGIAVVALLLFFFAPDKYAFYPRCAFYTATGLQCPGCGGLRCLHHLLHGRLAMAFHFNALILCLTPFAVVGGSVYLFSRITGRAIPRAFQGTTWIWALVVVTVAFGIFRNIPFGHNGISEYNAEGRGRNPIQNQKGRIKGNGINGNSISSVPTGRKTFSAFGPGIEMPGYLQMSLPGQINFSAGLQRLTLNNLTKDI